MISFDNNFYALDDNSWVLTKKKDDKKVEFYTNVTNVIDFNYSLNTKSFSEFWIQFKSFGIEIF